MARRKSTDNDPGPEGGWIAPGPGRAQTSEEFLAGTHDQTPEEYEAEIRSDSVRRRQWSSIFAKEIETLKKETKA